MTRLLILAVALLAAAALIGWAARAALVVAP